MNQFPEKPESRKKDRNTSPHAQLEPQKTENPELRAFLQDVLVGQANSDAKIDALINVIEALVDAQAKSDAKNEELRIAQDAKINALINAQANSDAKIDALINVQGASSSETREMRQEVQTNAAKLEQKIAKLDVTLEFIKRKLVELEPLWQQLKPSVYSAFAVTAIGMIIVIPTLQEVFKLSVKEQIEATALLLRQAAPALLNHTVLVTTPFRDGLEYIYYAYLNKK